MSPEISASSRNENRLKIAPFFPTKSTRISCVRQEERAAKRAIATERKREKESEGAREEERRGKRRREKEKRRERESFGTSNYRNIPKEL